MPTVSIDISLFVQSAAFGRISGSIDVAVIPQIGDYMSFGIVKKGIPFPDRGAMLDLLKVTDRIISADTDGEVLVSLADITVETADDARLTMAFFEECHGLFGEPYGTDE